MLFRSVIFDQNGTLQQIYLPKERQFNPLGDLTLEGLMSMTEKDGDDDIAAGLTHYRLKELWVLKDGKDPKSMDEADWEVYGQDRLSQLRFTNNPADVEDDGTGNVILIQETEEKKTVFRLAYEQAQRDNELHSAVFYDYDITDGTESGGSGTEEYPYIVNSNKQGINSASNAGTGARYAFGNANTGNGWDGKDYKVSWGSQTPNVANSNNLSGCTFGIVDGIEGDSVRWSSGMTGPKLFGTGDKYGAGENYVAGKTIHNGYSLEFKGEGDTYTLTAVKKSGATVLSELERFKYNRDNWNYTKKIFSNEFWPLDGETDRADKKFGKTTYLKSTDGTVFPSSDFQDDHNPYFGMKFTIKFSLPADYTGPLEYYFYGDDDMWVFMGNRLVCDIGGVHSSVGQYVDLWDYVEGTRQDHPAQEYVLTFFYTERGASGSTCWMQYTLPNAVTIPEIGRAHV